MVASIMDINIVGIHRNINFKPFSSIPVGAWFEFDGAYWAKVEDDGNGWNALTGKDRWGQFEPNEMIHMIPGTGPKS